MSLQIDTHKRFNTTGWSVFYLLEEGKGGRIILINLFRALEFAARSVALF